MRRFLLTTYLPLILVVALAFTGCAPKSTGDGSTATEAESAGDVGARDDAQDEEDAEEEADEDDTAAAGAADTVPAQPADTVPAEGQADAAAGPSLSIGDPAPTLAIAKWMKGDSVDSFANGQVYVVEFWATWCGPCRTSMPHLSQLQDEYGPEVRFIGVSNETEETVQGFFDKVQNEESGKTWNEVITYAIALDDADKNTGDSYMRAAQQNGIPTAFIVGRDGYIEWIGHPMRMDQPLAKVVSGEWDRTAALAEFEAQQKSKAVMSQLQRAISRARSTDDWSELRQILADAADAGLPPQVVQSLRFDVAMMSKSFEEAHGLAEEVSTANWDNAQQLNQLAWNLVTRIPREEQNHELALRIARRASELTDDQDGSILDTVARVFYESGDLNEAVNWQRKAVECAPDDLAQIKSTLEKYESELAETNDQDASAE